MERPLNNCQWLRLANLTPGVHAIPHTRKLAQLVALAGGGVDSPPGNSGAMSDCCCVVAQSVTHVRPDRPANAYASMLFKPARGRLSGDDGLLHLPAQCYYHPQARSCGRVGLCPETQVTAINKQHNIKHTAWVHSFLSRLRPCNTGTQASRFPWAKA